MGSRRDSCVKKGVVKQEHLSELELWDKKASFRCLFLRTRYLTPHYEYSN